MRRSFWALVTAALLGVASVSFFAWRVLVAQLPCHFSRAQIPVSAMATCIGPVPIVGRHGLLPALVVAGIALATILSGLVSLSRQVWRLHHFHRTIASLPRVRGGIPRGTYLDQRRIVILDMEEACCLTVGLFRPRIILSSGALSRLGPDALHAALAHEECHVRNRDPLRLLTATIAASALFFAPLLKDLADHAHLSEEVAADEAAAALFGEPALLSALRALVPAVRGPRDPGPISSMAASQLLPGRLAALVEGHPRARLSRSRIGTTAASVLLLVVLGLAVPLHATAPPPLPVHRVVVQPGTRHFVPGPTTS